MLLQTHALISGIHDMTGLPWAASIPLAAFLAKTATIVLQTAYGAMLYRKRLDVWATHEATKIALERKKVEQEHKAMSPQQRQRILAVALDVGLTRALKDRGAQRWKSLVLFVNIPIWVAMMQTIRRMTGTEDGMLVLAAKSLTGPTRRTQNLEPSTLDGLIPVEPSLATEGMLWFDNLMMPDPCFVLPFALSGLVFFMYSARTGIRVFRPLPSGETGAQFLNQQTSRGLKLAALAIGPATLMFPSAMLLYWFSSNLAAVTVHSLLRIWARSLAARSRERSKPGHDKPKTPRKPKMQENRGQTMPDLRNGKKKKK